LPGSIIIEQRRIRKALQKAGEELEQKVDERTKALQHFNRN